MSTDASTRVSHVGSEYAPDLIGLPGRAPLLSWQVQSSTPGTVQLSAELQASGTADFASVLASSQIEGDASQFIVAPGGNLSSREVRWFRVRIATAAGSTEWSQPLRIEAGLLEPSDFAGVAIGDEGKAQGPAALLRTEFTLDQPIVSARLYGTAHGVFDTMINGERVGDEHLAPGWTPYHDRQLVVAHDVTDLLQQGANAWGVLLGDGWYRGKFGFFNKPNNYGEHSSFLGHLEITFADGSTRTVATGPDWKTSTGGVRLGCIYDGCDFDYNFAQPKWCRPGFDASHWTPVTVREFDKSLLEPRAAAPIRTVAELPAVFATVGNLTKVNLMQNISGWLRVKVQAKAGTKLNLRHAEVLNPDGSLHTQALRGARATDNYTIAVDGEYTLEPKLTFHGFQYAEILVVEGEATVLDVEGIAISSDNEFRGEIETNHELLNKLVSNTTWSLLDNFVGVPTDCPQRDERLGWTGDAQAFTWAAQTLVDGYQFFKTWLTDLYIEQSKFNGKVPHVVPDLLWLQTRGEGPFDFPQGDAGWADAATIIPWSIYQRYGDLEILRQQLPSMRAWVEHNKNDHEGLLIPDRMSLGDWLDPDAPNGQPFPAKVSVRFMINAFMTHSTEILADTEELLGNHDEAAKHRARVAELKPALWAEMGEEAAKTPTGASILLEFDLVPDSERERVAAGLAKLTRDTDGRIATGFLGTPVILDAMSKAGNWHEAYLMLLRTKRRSWLYPITVGATSIWERWEALDEDGNVPEVFLHGGAEGADGGMISFNHYAYGAVVDWIFRNVGGIAPTTPGYRTVSIAPRPHNQLTESKALFRSGYGHVAVDWKVNGSELTATIEVPFGVTATLDLPANADSTLTVNGSPVALGSSLTHGHYQVALTNPQIAA